MKNSSDTIGNRTRDLLTCSTVPQPTAPPWSPLSTGTRWKSVVSLMPRPLHPLSKETPVPIKQEAGGPQSQSKRNLGEELNHFLLPGFKLRIIQPMACTLNDYATQGGSKVKF